MTNEERIAQLEQRIAELEGTAPPPPNVKFERINPLDRLSMPQSATQAMVDAVPNGLMREIVNDNRSRPASSSIFASEPDHRPRNNVAVEIPLAPPAGIKLVDALCDAQDAKDRRRR